MRHGTKLAAAAAALVALACGRCGGPQQPRVDNPATAEREGTTAAGTPTGTVNSGGQAGQGSQEAGGTETPREPAGGARP